MYLRSIKLRGFKSFPEPVEVRLEPGVAVVVGPNGSGKSNIADAIVWAAGSLSPTELRAEKPDDVLFAGSAGGRPAEACEVELVFDNSDGEGPLEYSEISIARRLHRGGEGQYLVNGAQVRRLDLVELLADVGLGGELHSIIGQGRVEQILASKPAERRALVEEAAGLGKFKRRRHRAELKLARVAAQVERAHDLEAEVRKRLRPLALQASAAERAQKLSVQLDDLRARLAASELERLEGRYAGVDERRMAAAHERRRREERLEGALAERRRVEEELGEAATRHEEATAALYRLRTAAERLGVRAEGAVEAGRSLRTEAEHVRRRGEERRGRLVEELERSLAEREGLPPAARALADEGERLALALLDVDEGYDHAVAAALAWRASAVVAGHFERGVELLERARDGGLGALSVLVPVRPGRGRAAPPVSGAEPLARFARPLEGGSRVAELLEDVWLVAAGDLTGAERGLLVTREGFAYDPARGELWFAGEAAESALLGLHGRRRRLAEELEAQAAVDVHHAELLERLAAASDRLAEALARARTAVERFEAPLLGRVDAGGSRSSELGEELRRLGAREAELRRAVSEAAEAQAAIGIEAARLEAELEEVRGRLPEDAVSEAIPDEEAEELAATVARLERRREALGQVNPLAAEEHAQESERLAELVAQREDLERSLAELEKLRSELTETVERRFAETYAAVERHFAEVAGTLFPGGTGRLRQTDDDEEDAGVEIELQPAGKRITRLSLLSGGEKALGAISFLFALFLARPCPFYLLDEVEAALDDTNIGRFVELLRRFADRAQFVVVTHQKRTMEAADILYGVTMGADGISQIVSKRLAAEPAGAQVA